MRVETWNQYREINSPVRVSVVESGEIWAHAELQGFLRMSRDEALALHTQLGDALEQLGCVAVRVTDDSEDGEPA